MKKEFGGGLSVKVLGLCCSKGKDMGMCGRGRSELMGGSWDVLKVCWYG